MEKQSIIQYWIDTADRDYKTMINLFNSGDYHWSLFIGHLVIEKLLKAVYVQNVGLNTPKIHDLVRLAEKSKIRLKEEDLDKLEIITRFNISVRYPDYQQEFYRLCTEEFASKAICSIKEIRLWLLGLVKK